MHVLTRKLGVINQAAGLSELFRGIHSLNIESAFLLSSSSRFTLPLRGQNSPSLILVSCHPQFGPLWPLLVGKSGLIPGRNQGKRKATITKSTVKNESEISIISSNISQRCSEIRLVCHSSQTPGGESGVALGWQTHTTFRKQYFGERGPRICKIPLTSRHKH